MSLHDSHGRRTTPRPRHSEAGLLARSGYTLLELALSIAVVSVLMVAVGSTIIVAAKAVPDADSPATTTVNSGRIVDAIAAELYAALRINERTAATIEFTVPDRNGDGLEETIRYAWSGTTGDPLTRQLNGGSIVTVAENVQHFALGYDVLEVADTSSTQTVEGDEVLLIGQDHTNAGITDTFDVQSGSGCAEYFVPDLPADAESWRVTRVQFVGESRGSSSGSMVVAVRQADANGNPSTTAIESIIVQEADLVAATWHEVPFSNAGALSPGQGYFVTFTHNSGSSTVARLTIGTNSTATPETTFYSGDDEGDGDGDGDGDTDGTWQADNTTNTWVYIYGRVTAPDPNATADPSYYLRSADITLSTGSSPDSVTTAGATLLNRPEVSGP